MRGIDEWVHFSNAFLINVLFLLSRLFFFFFFFLIYLIFEISVGIHVQSALVSRTVVTQNTLLYQSMLFGCIFYCISLQILLSQIIDISTQKETNSQTD